MFRVKDHLLSLAAVFLALGLGILVGSGMSDDLVLRQQRLLIEQMSEDYRMLRGEKTSLEAELEQLSQELSFWEEYQAALYPGMVQGSLIGREVVVISHGANLPDGVLQLLADAGVNFSAVINVAPRGGWDELDHSLADLLAAGLGGLSTESDVMEQLNSLADAQKIQLNVWNDRVADTVIFYVGNRQSASGQFLESLATHLLASEMELIALEASDVHESLLEDMKKMGISTIDNVDTVFGRMSLLSVMLGQHGHYGVKSAAEQFIASF